MANMVNMYEGKSFSPSTTLTQGVNDTATRIYVEDVSVFPDAPNIAVIGATGVGEVVKYYAKGLDFLDGVERGVDGVAQSWSVGDAIARNFTKTDYEALRQNITTLNEDKTESADVADIQIASVEAGAKANIGSGDTIAVAFGKLRKWFTSFKALAWLDTVGTAQITDKNVTNAKLADVAAYTVKGNKSAIAGMPGDMTATEVRTLLNVADGADKTDTATSGAAIKATPVNTDYVALVDSAAENALKRVAWANIKGTLKTYFDTLYATLSHTHGSIASDGKIGSTANLPVFTGAGGAVETKTVAEARNTLGLGNTTGALPVANGGTGAVDAAAARANLGAQAAMLAGTDYVVPPTQLTALPTSGTAITANAEYRVSATVGTYTFTWPSSPFEVWLKFTTAATFNIAFPAGTTYVGGAPTFKASTTYEMSVKDGVVIVQEVAA